MRSLISEKGARYTGFGTNYNKKTTLKVNKVVWGCFKINEMPAKAGKSSGEPLARLLSISV